MKAITCLLLLFCQTIAFCGDVVPNNIPSKCEVALNVCISVVGAQDHQIKDLQLYTKKLENTVAKEESPVIPWYVWLGAGVVGGFALGRSFK